MPVYGLGGWYDVFLQSTLNNFMGVRRGHKVLIGPWIHSLGDRGRCRRTGDIDFGPASLVDLRGEELRWFDHWLKGIDSGVLAEPPVRVFVMGANRWRTADDWPVPGTRFVEHYFHGDGRANSLVRRRPARPPAPGVGAPRPVRLRSARARAHARRQHLLRGGRHADPDGTA